MFSIKSTFVFFTWCIFFASLSLPFVSSSPKSKLLKGLKYQIEHDITPLIFFDILKESKVDYPIYKELKNIRDDKEIIKLNDNDERKAIANYLKAIKDLENTFTVKTRLGLTKHFNLHEVAPKYNLEFLKYVFEDKYLSSYVRDLRKDVEYMLKTPYEDWALNRDLLLSLLDPETGMKGVHLNDRLIQFYLLEGSHNSVMRNFITKEQIKLAKEAFKHEIFAKELDTQDKRNKLVAYLESLNNLLLVRSKGVLIRALKGMTGNFHV